jgi:UDP-N-acetylmuramoyl-L-alanyl-D-glutamate--2,6-diaminopimelate ligase
METFHNVPGRLESVVARNEAVAFIDYAHSPDALTKALSTLRDVVESQKSGPPIRIITVFGCGGDRDKGKRPLMMEAALKLSDAVIVTSDNPRTEDPAAIIEDILKGRTKHNTEKNVEVYVEIDREKAIKAAIAMSRPQDLILIAGKGHENYQIFGTEKRHFSDREVVENYSWESK